MAIPQDIIAEIKYRNDIESVISQYVLLKRRGKNLVGLCPFHNEKTPSFTIYPENGSFYCFGCKVGGDVFTFTGLIERLDYIESVKLLADKCGVMIPENDYEDNSIQRLKQTILEINRESARFYHKYLMSEGGKWARDYLLGRGLTLNTIKKFGLGCAPDSWDSLIIHLKSKGYSIPDMLQANVIAKSSRGTYYDRFRNRVMFPVINLRGNVIAFSGRINPNETKGGGKYENTADTPVYKKSENLFAFNYAKNDCADSIILVEGNMDVNSLHQAGFTNTVAALGTAFTTEQAKLISRYTKEIIITFDSDLAGQNAVKKAIDILKFSGLSVKVLVLPEGKDPDEYIKKNSPEKFKALLSRAESATEYLLRIEAEKYNTDEADGKLKYIKAAAYVLAATEDDLTIDLYAGKLAEKYNLSRNAVDSVIKKIREEESARRHKKEIQNVVAPRIDRTEINPEKRFNKRACVAAETVIAVLISHPDYFSRVEDVLPPSKFITALNKRIYGDIYNLLKDGNNIDLSLFGQRYTAGEMGYLVSLQSSVKAERNPLQVLLDSMEVIEKENLIKSSREGEDDADWANRMQAILEQKKGEK